jgi:hypothetical protein
MAGNGIPSAYGYASIISGPPDRPEPIRAEARKLDRKQVMRKFRWSDVDFDRVVSGAFDFPVAMRRNNPLGAWGTTLIWREDQLDVWAARTREHATEILRLVGE